MTRGVPLEHPCEKGGDLQRDSCMGVGSACWHRRRRPAVGAGAIDSYLGLYLTIEIVETALRRSPGPGWCTARCWTEDASQNFLIRLVVTLRQPSTQGPHAQLPSSDNANEISHVPSSLTLPGSCYALPRCHCCV